MNPTRLLTLLVLGMALIAAPAVARAQTVVGVQNLSFGTVIPGVPTTVLPSDAVRAGQFRISNAAFRTVSVSFALPTVMNGPLGATMPISFSNSSATVTGLFASATPFDPNSPHSFFSWFGNYQVLLGGTVNPSPIQRSGGYTANIVMTVIFP